jgi:hypothetical protein
MNNDEIEQDKNKKASRLRYINPAIVILFLISSALLFAALTQETKPDPASEKIIRKVVTTMIPKEPNELTDDDFAQIKQFAIDSSREIAIRYFEIGMTPGHDNYYDLSDIRLLEKFKNLEKLNLKMITFPKSKIPAWMRILSKIGIYDIEKKCTIDLSPLSKLKHLEELNLGGSAIRDLKPLEGLNIKYLQLFNTPVSNIEPIMSLNQLRCLDIFACPNIKDKDIEDLKKINPSIIIFPIYKYLQNEQNKEK